ncbi:MAG: ABC transporter substrate-binding protein [Gammaproteobacteria bacterium]|nr:ABC transporter substrate-binding protein [Gammaproteobacteria bacterium]
MRDTCHRNLGGLNKLALCALVGFLATSPVVAEDIVLGYIAAATGELAPYGSIPGVQCGVDILNDKGGVLGGQKLKLLTRDMKSDPALAGTAAQELIDEGAVALFGPPTDDTLIPVGQMALPHEIPVISVGSTQVQWPAAIPEIAYLTPYGDNAAASAAAHHAREQGYETAYLMISHDVGSYSIATPRFFGETFERLGGKVLGEMNWNWGTTDYSPQVTEFAAMDPKPDVIFSAFIMPDGGVFVRQLHAAGLNIPVYATDGMDDPTLLEVGGKGAELVTFTTHGFPSEGSRLKEFYDDCESRGFTIQNIFFGLGGEAVEVVRHAIETAGSAEPGKINAAIKEIDQLAGVTTDSITFKGQGGVPLKRMTMVTVKDAAFTPVTKILPDWVPDGFSKWVPSP